MPRTRQLKHDFFLDENLAAIEPHGRLLFAGLWLLADREGRLEDRPAKIKAQIFPYEGVDVKGLVLLLAANKFINRYSFEGKDYIEIPGFKTHQHIHPDEKRSVLPVCVKSPGISEEARKSPEITPVSFSPSSSFSPSPKQPEQAPIDLKNLGSLVKGPDSLAGDYGDYRLPLNFGGGKYSRAYVVNLEAETCEWLIKTFKPGPKVRAALQWRIDQKKSEAIR